VKIILESAEYSKITLVIDDHINDGSELIIEDGLPEDKSKYISFRVITCDKTENSLPVYVKIESLKIALDKIEKNI
jgi:hypothetical protein